MPPRFRCCIRNFVLYDLRAFEPRWLRPTPRRGSQVVRQESAKLLCVGSIPTPASNLARVTSTSCAGFFFGGEHCEKGCDTRCDTQAVSKLPFEPSFTFASTPPRRGPTLAAGAMIGRGAGKGTVKRNASGRVAPRRCLMRGERISCSPRRWQGEVSRSLTLLSNRVCHQQRRHRKAGGGGMTGRLARYRYGSGCEFYKKGSLIRKAGKL